MESRGEFTSPEQANVAQQVTRTMSKLVEKSVNASQERCPVQAHHVLAQEAPALFNGVEPRGVGGQAERFQTGQRGQDAEDIWMGMDRPVILDVTAQPPIVSPHMAEQTPLRYSPSQLTLPAVP